MSLFLVLNCEYEFALVLTQEIKFFGAPKSLQMVTAAMKLKDAYSLGGKLCQT